LALTITTHVASAACPATSDRITIDSYNTSGNDLMFLHRIDFFYGTQILVATSVNPNNFQDCKTYALLDVNGQLLAGLRADARAMCFGTGDDEIYVISNQERWNELGICQSLPKPLTFNYSGYTLSLYGEEGNDGMEGGVPSDNLYGGVGNDTLVQRTQSGYLIGGDGNDWLEGSFMGETFDFLEGGTGPNGGANKIFDDAGNNEYLYGAIGNDCIQDYSGVFNLMHCGGGSSDRRNVTSGNITSCEVFATSCP
jgi:hypothetical protein